MNAISMLQARRQRATLGSLRIFPAAVPLVSLALGLIVWQLVSLFYADSILPGPTAVWSALRESLDSGDLLGSTAITMRRVVLGYTVGTAIGIAISLAAGRSRRINLLLMPYVDFLRFIPAIALLTPLIIWFGIGETSKVILIAIAALFTVAIQGMAGIAHVPMNRVRAGEMLGAKRGQIFWQLQVPSMIPGLLTGMRIAMGFSFATIVEGPGASPGGAELVFLRQEAGRATPDQPKVRAQDAWRSGGADEPTVPEQQLERAVRSIRDERFHASTNTFCSMCEFRTLCPTQADGLFVLSPVQEARDDTG